MGLYQFLKYEYKLAIPSNYDKFRWMAMKKKRKYDIIRITGKTRGNPKYRHKNTENFKRVQMS